MAKIVARRITSQGWTLVDGKSGEAILAGMRRADFRGDMNTIVGGVPPRHPGSEGHVSTKDGGHYYASVYGLRWLPPQNGGAQ